MSFLTSQQIISQGRTWITNFSDTKVKSSSYELSLGNEVFITNEKLRTKKVLRADQQICIPAGQFALLITKESLSLPNDILGFISIKTSIKFQGLVNISGFHVDPGFHGKLIFSVYNAGSKGIAISEDKPIFVIWFSKLDSNDAKPYSDSNRHYNQQAISDENVNLIFGEIPSPNNLKKKIEKLEVLNKVFFALVGATIATIIFFGNTFLNQILDSKVEKYLTNKFSSKTIQMDSTKTKNDSIIKSK